MNNVWHAEWRTPKMLIVKSASKKVVLMQWVIISCAGIEIYIYIQLTQLFHFDQNTLTVMSHGSRGYRIKWYGKNGGAHVMNFIAFYKGKLIYNILKTRIHTSQYITNNTTSGSHTSQYTTNNTTSGSHTSQYITNNTTNGSHTSQYITNNERTNERTNETFIST